MKEDRVKDKFAFKADADLYGDEELRASLASHARGCDE